MSGLNDREKAFENRFAQDQELQFRVRARRNKILGVWAGQKLGKSDADLEEYARAVVISDFAEPGDDDVLLKVLNDFQDAGVPIERPELRREMDALMRTAMDEIMHEE